MNFIIEMASGMRCDDNSDSHGIECPPAAVSREGDAGEHLGLALVAAMGQIPATRGMPASLHHTDITAFLDTMD